jgi:3-oxoacyl-[acyl-carrier protein] reductase
MAVAERTALVTGSGKNIGRACALYLARDGFNVVLNGSRDRDACEAVAAEAREFGVEALVAMGDTGKREDVNRIVKEALAQFVTVDAFVHNAAIRPHQEMSEADWDRVFDVNFRSGFLFARAFLPGMVQKSWGRIVSFVGMNAIAGHAGRAHVSASKHAIWGMTKTLAKEFGPKGVTCNVISPGTIQGEAADARLLENNAKLKPGIPVGRLGTPEDIAAMVSLLCSEDGGFINGQMLQVNGGVAT